MLTVSKKTSNVIYIGVHLTEFHCHLVWLDEQNQIHQMNGEEEQIDELKTNLFKQLTKSNYDRMQFICAIPSHRIWSKTLIIPQHLNEIECDQQSRFVLQNELPIPLEESWFDHCFKHLNQTTTRIDIFAINKQVAQQHLNEYHYFNIAVLDSAVRAILRAFYFLCPQYQNNADVLWIYQDEHQTIALQQKPHQCYLIQQIQPKLTALFEQFCQRYAENPSICVFYSALSVPTPENWQRVETEYSFIALGCALWNKDLL